MLPKTSSNACRLAGVLDSDLLVVNRNHVCATVSLPGLQHWHGCPALVQGQLREEQEAVIKQKQQRSLRASCTFCCLLCLCLLEGALIADKEQFTPCMLLARQVCSWRQLAASAAGPGASEGSDSHSSSFASGGCCGGQFGAT
jgi:hypothetical protein